MKTGNALVMQRKKNSFNQNYPLTQSIKQGNFGISIEKRNDKVILLLLIKDTHLEDLEIKSTEDMLTIEVDQSELVVKNEITVIIEITEGKISPVKNQNIYWHVLEVPVL